jgi:hypothetical protein
MTNKTDNAFLLMIVVSIAVIIGFSYLVQIYSPKGSVMVYDCRLAEISPDYPISVKEACRKTIGRI